MVVSLEELYPLERYSTCFSFYRAEQPLNLKNGNFPFTICCVRVPLV